MDKMKQWVALTAVGVLVVLAAGWFLVVSPKRAEAAKLRTQAAGLSTSISGLEVQLATLKAQAKQLPQYEAQLSQVAAKLPNNPALPSLIRALSSAADAAGVELVTVAPGAPVAYTPRTLGAAAASRPAAPAASGAKVGVGPAATPAGALQSISLSLSVSGGYFQTEQFLDKLENLARALKVTALTMAPGGNPVAPQPAVPAGGASSSVTSGPDGSILQSSITATVFMAPSLAPAQPAVVAPAK